MSYGVLGEAYANPAVSRVKIYGYSSSDYDDIGDKEIEAAYDAYVRAPENEGAGAGASASDYYKVRGSSCPPCRR